MVGTEIPNAQLDSLAMTIHFFYRKKMVAVLRKSEISNFVHNSRTKDYNQNLFTPMNLDWKAPSLCISSTYGDDITS